MILGILSEEKAKEKNGEFMCATNIIRYYQSFTDFSKT
jgi:hypothetical protein